MKTPIPAIALILLVGVLAAGAPAGELQLQLSWSASAQQDTLEVAQSGWTQCYLWVRPGAARDGFVGFWGTLYHSGGTAAHTWRYLGDGAPGDFDLNPAIANQPIAYLDAECESLAGPRVICEFDVYVDAALVSRPGSRESQIGLYAADLSTWDPLVFYRVDPGAACGLHSEGFAAEPNVITAVAAPVATARATFGGIKALFR